MATLDFFRAETSTTDCCPFPPSVNDDVFRVSAPGATLVEHEVLHQPRTIHAHPAAEPDSNHRAPLVVQRQRLVGKYPQIVLSTCDCRALTLTVHVL